MTIMLEIWRESVDESKGGEGSDFCFPSRPHLLTSEVDQYLSRVRASEATSTSSSSISHQINGLQDLHDCVDKLLQLSLIQQALAQDEQKKGVDELLNGSLRLLDLCSIAKDSLLQTKECVKGLQSILRRRRADDMELNSEVKKYLTSRKAMKKATHKALVTLKGKQNKCASAINDKNETKATISMLREVEAITFTVTESLLSFISGPRTPSKRSSWSLVSKLMQPKRIACEEDEADINEFEKVNAALSTIISQKTGKSDNISHVLNQLKELERSIQDLEEGLECLSRRLIRTRVPLLNILKN
ncbi:uncharacterized protein LOC116106739 [Pistacia vera]|uniref:uncharacterized protein LOC116106739 n=1 Tax=Pistacia vera TaxID=55513 RepID=UPI001263AF71|nr:uncharacterized protein LOC116106739 [Pistacia vera]